MKKKNYNELTQNTSVVFSPLSIICLRTPAATKCVHTLEIIVSIVFESTLLNSAVCDIVLLTHFTNN